jgi:hypothetical protein
MLSQPTTDDCHVKGYRFLDPARDNFAVIVDKLYVGDIGRQPTHALESLVACARSRKGNCASMRRAPSPPNHSASAPIAITDAKHLAKR